MLAGTLLLVSALMLIGILLYGAYRETGKEWRGGASDRPGAGWGRAAEIAWGRRATARWARRGSCSRSP